MTTYITKEQTKCQHDWHWNYDCFEDARIIDGNMLGIPVKCYICDLEAVEWYKRLDVRDDKNNLII